MKPGRWESLLCLRKTSCSGCRFMASQPDKWDYTLAGVPSPLTDELESQQLAKQVICCSIPLCDVVLHTTLSWSTCCSTCWCCLHSARALAAAPLCVICSDSYGTCCSTWLCYLQSARGPAAASVGAICSQPGHLLQHVLCCLQSACSLAAAFLCAVRSQTHLCMYLQVAFACPAAHPVVLLAVNCIIVCCLALHAFAVLC